LHSIFIHLYVYWVISCEANPKSLRTENWSKLEHNRSDVSPTGFNLEAQLHNLNKFQQ